MLTGSGPLALSHRAIPSFTLPAWQSACSVSRDTTNSLASSSSQIHWLSRPITTQRVSAVLATRPQQKAAPGNRPPRSGTPSRGNSGRSQEALVAAVETYRSRLQDGDAQAAAGLDELLDMLCTAGMFRAAWTVYELDPKKRSRLRYNTFQKMCLAAIQAGEPSTALRIFRDLEGSQLSPNHKTVSSIISALSRLRRKGQPSAEIAYQLWTEMHQGGGELDDVAYRAGLNACVNLGRLEEAAALLGEMQRAGCPPDVRTHNILLKAASREGAWAQVDALMEEMRQLGLSASGATHGTLVDGFVRAGQLSRAQQALQDAEDAGAPLDVWSYSALIKGYVQGGDVARARKVLQQMQAAGVPGNAVTYSTLLDGCVKSGQTRAARAVLSQMQRLGLQPNSVTYNSLLRGLAQDEQIDLQESFDLLGVMEGAGVSPSVDTYNTLMVACKQRHQLQSVPRIFSRLIMSGITPDSVSYTVLISSLCLLGRIDDALQAFSSLQDAPGAKSDLYAHNVLVNGLSKAGRMAEAESYLELATQIAQQEGVALPIEGFGAVVKGYAQRQEVQPALRVVKKFWELGGMPDQAMFDCIAELCVRTGEFKPALQVVRAMEKMGKPASKRRLKELLSEFTRQEYDMKRKSKQGSKVRNESLERFKFWLGLPNTYYNN